MKKSAPRTIIEVGLVLLLVGVFVSLLSRRVQAVHTTFADGDVFVAVGSSSVQWRHPDGTLNQTLTCTSASSTFTTGMAFDAANNLYVTMFDGGNVCTFDTSGTDIGTFGSDYSGKPESILFDAAGDAFVGAVDGDNDIRKFDATGTPLAQFDVATEDRGSDWIDLSCDQCTMLYTSEGTSIKRFDVCTNTQLADFVPSASGLLSGPDFALRIIPRGAFAGQVLVADSVNIKRISADGSAVLATYDAAGEDVWFALNLDPDGTSFWSADSSTADVHKFDIASGADLLSFNTGTGATTVFGVTVKGEITCARCGDGIVDPGEECDDGNNASGDGCSATCVTEFCGDGIVNNSGTEECDDGANGDNGDGCTDSCLINFDPDCSAAAASPAALWPPNHKGVDISIVGVTDPDGDVVSITVDSISQDEPVKEAGTGSGNTCPDATGVGTDTPEVRAERAGNKKVPGDGRVYHIAFTAEDGQGGTCEGEVLVCVPHDQGQGSVCIDEGPLFDSTVCP